MRRKIRLLKHLNIVLVLLISGQQLWSQYTVTKIVGQVRNKSTGERLAPGSKLKDDDLLEFSTAKDLVRVIVSGKGIYIISPTPGSSQQQSFIVEMLKSALKVKSREGYLSGRSEESDMVPLVFETESQVSNYNHIGVESLYRFDTTEYKLTNGNRFFLQVQYAGEKPEIHALRTRSDTLFFAAKDFEAADPHAGKVKYMLGFYDKAANKSESLAVLSPYIDTTGEMETIIRLVLTETMNAGDGTARKIAYAEVYEALGKPSIINFEKAFNRISAELLKKEDRP